MGVSPQKRRTGETAHIYTEGNHTPRHNIASNTALAAFVEVYTLACETRLFVHVSTDSRDDEPTTATPSIQLWTLRGGPRRKGVSDELAAVDDSAARELPARRSSRTELAKVNVPLR